MMRSTLKQTLRCRHFLLLEVLIALALTMILLSALTSFYMQINSINKEVEKEQAFAFKKLYLSTRLAAILPGAINPKENDFVFFSSFANNSLTKNGSQTLTLTYDNKTQLVPEFCNTVLSRLYITPSNQLCLDTWPSPARWGDVAIPPMKHEILFENVQDLSFEFYMPPKKDRKAILSKNENNKGYKDNEFLPLNPEGEWKKEWQQEYKELPPLMKIHLTLSIPGKTRDKFSKSEILTLVYPFPLSRLIIVYE